MHVVEKKLRWGQCFLTAFQLSALNIIPSAFQTDLFVRHRDYKLNTLRTGSFKLFKLFKRPLQGFLTILTL